MTGRKRSRIDLDESEQDTTAVTRRSDECESSTSKFEDHITSIFESDDEDDIAPSDIDVTKMRILVKEFKEFMNNNNKKSTSVMSMNNLVKEFLMASSSPELNVIVFISCFRKHLQTALKQNNINVWNSLNCIDAHMNCRNYIKTYPDYPKKPPELHKYYATKYKMQYLTNGAVKELKKKIADDLEGRNRCEAEVRVLEEKYLENLEAFANNHPEFSQEQKLSLRKHMIHIRQKLNPEPPKPSNLRVRPNKNKKTAFDLYLATVTDKYTELDTEARMKKLTKKYAKLPEEIRETFEKVAGAI